MAKNEKKRPATNAGRPSGSGDASSSPSSGAGSTGTGSIGTGSAGASGVTGGTSSGGGEVHTSTNTVKDVQWGRRKAWPLLLGSAAVLGGASAANYAWANPDGKLTSKAQSELSAKYPGATVRGSDDTLSVLMLDIEHFKVQLLKFELLSF